MGGSKVRKTEGVKYAGGPVLRKKGGGMFLADQKREIVMQLPMHVLMLTETIV